MLQKKRKEVEDSTRQYISINVENFDKCFLTHEDVKRIKNQKENKIIHEYINYNSIFDYENFDQIFYKMKYLITLE